MCPLGYYCPLASSRALACEAGSYADREGMALCTECPQGYYCLANSSEFLTQRCPTGAFSHCSKIVFCQKCTCTHNTGFDVTVMHICTLDSFFSFSSSSVFMKLGNILLILFRVLLS